MEYDIALSFAGEDREYVEKVADYLRLANVKVFYDKYEQVDLWGKDLYEHLSDVYQNKARFTVMFISCHYARKLWTQHERKSAQARAFREKGEYILPARFDNTEVPGLNATVGYVDLRHLSPAKLAEAIREKLTQVGTLAVVVKVPQLGENKINPIDGAQIVYVPAAPFTMGTDDVDASSIRAVELPAYWVYKTPVTVAQYYDFCQASKRGMPPEPDWGWQDNHPIVRITWQDATDYAYWAHTTLPTEAEWEKAAQGTDFRLYPWGNEWDADKCVNWENSGGMTAQVGSKPEGASPCGALDMVGNVWEWCADWYDNTQTMRTIRGGSWANNDLRIFRAISRYRNDPECWNKGLGFRCVVHLPEPK